MSDIKVHVRFKLAALWTSLMFCYIYADYFGMYQPGQLQAMLRGQMGPLGTATQGVLVGAAVMLIVPSLMIFLSIALTPGFTRWLNIVFGIVYTVIIALTMVGAWDFYILYGIIEIALQLLVVWYAWTWPKSVAQPN